jgi:3-deoxy-manno-octulosonate cytidylyltransferase (CMP-KDO synthetase)
MSPAAPHTVAIIPARYASTRLPGKPLVDLGGKTMIRRVVEQVQQAKSVNDVIVATDDERIASSIASFGGRAEITPESLETGCDRVAYVARDIPAAELIVDVQGDEPLIDPRAIDEAVKPLAENPEIQVGTLVKKIDSAEELANPNVVKAVLDPAGYAVYFSRSPIPYMRDEQDMSAWHTRHVYYKHFGLYVFRREALLKFASWKKTPLERVENLEQLRLLEHGVRIKASVTRYDSVPVDTAEDALRVRALLREREGKQSP